MSEVIRFNYLYRDSANYKKFGCKCFGNPERLIIDEIEQSMVKMLIDGIYFYPEQIDIVKFKFHRFCDDNSWYEFESIEIFENVNSPSKDLEPIGNLILKLHKVRHNQFSPISGRNFSSNTSVCV